ncbi:Arylsulfatase [Pontiella desulfatans]|uniref:Arylsulfatase n=1 Tax=Pontiella desulfatans TaxID=2750659 RepID=A0A6C2U0U2_PONDE|nr:sulfatase [Pontiella desulfatans]SPS73827.1 sulfatase S1_16 [Kiritimatiellales bacterium]VGO13552.1 Arylsulfatase [Pontiella desulfatans]
MKNGLKWIVVGLVAAGSVVSAAPQKPNVVVILADDLGWMDLVSYASRVKNVTPEACFYETPHLDRLAKQGMSFTQAYSAALCSPGRSALLTGLYPARFGFLTASGHMKGSYSSRNTTPPAGYHIHDRKKNTPEQTNPALGYIGAPFTYALQSGQAHDEYDALTIAEALKGYRSAMLGKWHLGALGTEGYQPKDHGFEELAYFDHGGSPYFDWQQKWNGKGEGSWKSGGKTGEDLGIEYLTDDLTERAVRFIRECDKNKEPFFLYFAQFAVHSPREAKPEDIAYFENKPTRGWNGHSMPEYAGVLRGLDNSVGRVVDELNKLGIAENTLIIFMSDNGGINRENATSNLPLREGKGKLYDGGVRVPFIAYWPGQINGGSKCEIPIGVEDIFPTLLSVAGQADDLKNLDVDGRSILPLLKDPENKAKQYTRDTFFWHKAGGGLDKKGNYSPTRTAVRKGDYKLMFDEQGYLELYNLAQDIEEKNDLSEKMPEKTTELFKLLDEMIDEVVPMKYQRRPNPLYDPEANAKSKVSPYRNLRNLPIPTVAKPVSKPKTVKAAPASKVRIWAKGKPQQKDGSFVKMFVNPKGKTIVTLRQADGSEVNISHKVMTAEDLAYLESISAQATK